jgi:hypothetical protein
MPYTLRYNNKTEMWELVNQDTGEVTHVPSADNREEAEQVGRNREMFSHIRSHPRIGTRGVREHQRRNH